jgi:hypothetical protein
MQMCVFGMVTPTHCNNIERYFSEPDWPNQGINTMDIHSTGWLKIMLVSAQSCAEFLTNHFYKDTNSYTTNKVKIMIHANILDEFIRIINKFGINPFINVRNKLNEVVK